MAETTPVTPPYGTFATFWGFLEDLHQRGPAPQVFDAAVFGSRSTAARYETLNALKFFDLVDAQKRPTAVGRQLIEQPDVSALDMLLREHFAPVIELGLDNASSSQLDDALRAMGARDGSGLRKSRAFFLHAAQKAGIPLGPHLRAPAPRPNGPRRAKRPQKPAEGRSASQQVRQQPAADLRTRYVELLLAKIEKDDKPESALLDRVERALGLAVSPPSRLQGPGGEQGEGGHHEAAPPAGD